MVQCRACRLVYRNPRPTATDIRGSYATRQTNFTSEERVGNRRSLQFHRFLASLPGRPGRLLDVGCGYGFFLKMAQERGWEAVGVDLDPKAIAYASERLRVNALMGDLRDACFPDGSFDLVTLWNVLDHASDPVDLLREAHRVLKDNGRIFIRTPNVVWHYLNYRLANFFSHLGWSKVFDKYPHATFIFHQTNFSPRTLRLVLHRSGFAPVTIANGSLVPGDPYLGLGPLGKKLVALAKLSVYAIAQGVAMASGGRSLIGPSLKAWGRREKSVNPHRLKLDDSSA